jgi:Tfp pilus assembly protein FimT
MVLKAARLTTPISRAGSWPTRRSRRGVGTPQGVGTPRDVGTRRGGYTFLELTIIMAIIMMVAAIGVPRLLSWVNEGNLGAECRRLAGTIRYLRSKAAQHRESFFLTLDIEKAAYWSELRRDPSEIEHRGYYVSWEDPSDEEFETYEDDLVSRRELRRRVAFEHVVFAEGADEHYGKVRIEFRPDGTSETVAIYLTATDGRVATVMINGHTGRVTIYDYREELEPLPVLYEQYDLDE